MPSRCRQSLIGLVPILLMALAGWGGAARAEARPLEAPDLSWLQEENCAASVEVAALEAPDWEPQGTEPAAATAEPAKPAPEHGKACTTNAQCPKKHYCAKPAGDCKGKGHCAGRPEICTEIFKPVCGCDGKTYSNECFAANAGVNVRSEGACKKIACKTNKECPKGDFCAKEMGKCEDEGACVKRPVVCALMIVEPVCGCNGKTFGNICLAHSNGVSVKHLGKCEG